MSVESLSVLRLSGRDDAVRQQLNVADNCRSLLVTDLTNIRWLTGFTGSAGTLLVRPDDMVLVVDGRYGEQARYQTARSGAKC